MTDIFWPCKVDTVYPNKESNDELTPFIYRLTGPPTASSALRLSLSAFVIRNGIQSPALIPPQSTGVVFDSVVLEKKMHPGDIYDLIDLRAGVIVFTVMVRTRPHYWKNIPRKLSTYYSFLGSKQEGATDDGTKHHDEEFWKAIGVNQTVIDKLKGHSSTDRLVFCNRLIVNNITACNSTGAVTVEFSRYHLVFDDPARELFGNLPIFKAALFDSIKKINVAFPSTINDNESVEKIFLPLYTRLRKDAEWVVARGNEMVRNLHALSGMQNATGAKTIMVSGPPGTGKEAFARSIHYSRILLETKGEKAFVVCSARQLGSGESRSVQNVLKEKVRPFAKRSDLTIFIDELNKVESLSDMLSDFLRITEQPEEELGLEAKPTFIFGASDYLEKLAATPPQDFWTRVTHQLRIAHPLSRVSENDAITFLSGFLLMSWWQKIEESLGSAKELFGARHPSSDSGDSYAVEQYVNWAFGCFDTGTYRPSDLCKLVHNEMINTLAPLATKDELSVRGLRSIVAQIFSRMIWMRFDAQQNAWPASLRWINEGEPQLELLRRIVNDAIQDVLAVQNAARHTERTPAPKAENSAV